MRSKYIKRRDRRKQIIDFSTLAMGNKMPTDIDCMVELGDKGYILIEVKYRGAEMPYGQMLAYKRFCDDFQRLGKESMFMVAEHDVDDCEDDVDVSMCRVRWYYYKGKKYVGNCYVRDLYVKFVDYIERQSNG